MSQLPRCPRRLQPVIILCLLGLAACSSVPQASPAPLLAPAPAALPAPTPLTPVDPATSFAVMDALAWSLGREAVRENNGIPYVEFLAVSSGELFTATLSTRPGLTLDLLGAYLPTKNGAVHLPAVIGLEREGVYQYFNAALPPADAALSRDQALTAAREQFSRGQVFKLTIFKYVSLQGVDWQTCAAQETEPRFRTACELAGAYNAQFPAVERFFISKVLTDPAWIPLGWWFQPYYEDLRIDLPEAQ